MNEYFNNTYKGLAYVNRIRMVPVNRGDDFRALTLNVKSGKRLEDGKAQFTVPLDCKIVGGQAIAMFDRLLNEVDQSGDKKPVITASFEAADIYPDGFVSKSGQNEGKQVYIMKGRLLKLTHVYVNGKRFDEDSDTPETTERPIEGELMPSQDDSLPLVVTVDKFDPEYHSKVAKLAEQGYKWDDEEQSWYLPTASAA